MLTFISCAKTMTDKIHLSFTCRTSVPAFDTQAQQCAAELAAMSTQELGILLRVSEKIAAENRHRYFSFLSGNGELYPALLSYTGMVFKHIQAQDFTDDDFNYAQQHLLITSFLYGLLRPLDLIRNYRLEGNVKLESIKGETMFNFWKPVLTDFFITRIQEQGGVLVNLASDEMKNLFDWKTVCESVRVVSPEFYVLKNGKPANVTVYAKMCRGEMTRFILKNRIESSEALKGFDWEGFTFDEARSDEGRLVFVME